VFQLAQVYPYPFDARGRSLNPVPATTTTVTASGNVATNSNCRKDRAVTFAYSPAGPDLSEASPP
jgi:hypothetical protein